MSSGSQRLLASHDLAVPPAGPTAGSWQLGRGVHPAAGQSLCNCRDFCRSICSTDNPFLPSLPPLPPSLFPQDLVEACLQDDHTQRPSFPAIEARLAALLETHA